ncbi:MAG TPA: hypothetical protein VFQ20_00050 [Burkholderiaceae bacterium]|nr:hypothetical protein [Burkholderiaceae bacterium]
MSSLKTLGSALAAGIIVVSGVVLIATPARSVHETGTFELDGNVADPGTPGDDWASANFGGVGGSQLAKTGVIADAAPASIFTGGGSKDDLDLNGPLSGAGGWKHKSGSVPDKDDITNAYAVAYNVGGKLVIYAGADRLDNSGDAFMGFWFFQNQVGLGPVSGNSGPFVGQHAVGDVLVLANFTGGGTTVNIEVLKWVGTGGNVNGTLQRIGGIAGGTPATCSGSLGAGDLFCGVANTTGGETPPWTYLSKSGTSSFPTATFFEVGINISDVFAQSGGGAVPCFSSFMAETRSSSSVSAVLKDFALGSFPVCGIAVSKVCKDPILVTNTTVGYTIEGRVENTGFGTLTNVNLSDNPTAATAFERFACNGNVPTGGSLGGFPTTLPPLTSVCYRATFNTTTNGQDDVVTATASAGAATVSATAGADCPNLNLSPALDVTKACTTALAVENNRLVVQVNVSGTVTNTGDSALQNVTVTDTDVAGNLLGPTTLALGETKTFTASYFPSSAENRLSPGSSTFVPGLAKFSDTVTATATAPLGFQVTPDTATAECNLCPTCTPDACPGGICPQSISGKSQSNLFKRTR